MIKTLSVLALGVVLGISLLASPPAPYNEMQVVVRLRTNDAVVSSFYVKPRGSALAFREGAVDHVYPGGTMTYAYDKAIHYVTVNK